MRAKIGDLIKQRTMRGGPLPDVAAVRQRLGAGLDPASPEIMTGEWLSTWLESKGALKPSARRSYAQHVARHLEPALREIPLARLRPEQITPAILAIEASNATRHRVFATLGAALNAAVRQRLIPWNPCAGVELPPERHDPANVWGSEQVSAFLAATASERLHLAWRLVLLRGLRRGEVLGLTWPDVHLDDGYLRVTRTLMQLGGKVMDGTPKSRASVRVVSLDAATVQLLRAQQRVQRRERFAAGGAYADHGLVFCDEIGRSYAPDTVSKWFRQAAVRAGLPAIKLHEGRHSAATIALEAGLDIKVVSAQLGHSSTAITSDLYTHVRRVVADDAAERVAAMVTPKEIR